MIHLIPSYSTHQNWIFEKPNSLFSSSFSHILDYTAKATLASIPEYKQRSLHIQFYRIYPRQMASMKNKYKATRNDFFIAGKGSRFKIYLCTANIEKQANLQNILYANHFTRIVVTAIITFVQKNIGYYSMDWIESKVNEVCCMFGI